MIEAVEAFFSRRPVGWFRELSDDSVAAVRHFVDGEAILPLGPDDRAADVIAAVVNAIGPEALAVVDAGLASWLDALPPVGSLDDAAVERLGDLVEQLESVPETSARLVARLDDLWVRLPIFRSAGGYDGLGAMLRAISAHQADDGMAGLWRRLASLGGGLPPRLGAVGVTGLLRMPTDQAGFRPDVALALLEFGRVLSSEGERHRSLFLAVALDAAQALPFPNEWRAYQRHPVALQHERVGRWLAQLPPRLGGGLQLTPPNLPRSGFVPKAVTSLQEDFLAGRREDVFAYLDALRRNSVSDGVAYLVRALCGISNVARAMDPTLALRLAEESHRYEPSNAYTWVAITQAFAALDRVDEAVLLSFQAVQRFPFNSYVAGELMINSALAGLEPETGDAYDIYPLQYPDAASPSRRMVTRRFGPGDVPGALRDANAANGVLAWCRFLLRAASELPNLDQAGVELRFGRAAELADMLVDRAIDWPEALALRADIALYQGDLPLALRFAEQATARSSEPTGLRALGASTRASWLDRTVGSWDSVIRPWARLGAIEGFEGAAALGRYNTSRRLVVDEEASRVQRSCAVDLAGQALRIRSAAIGARHHDGGYDPDRIPVRDDPNDLLQLGWANRVLQGLTGQSMALNDTTELTLGDVEPEVGVHLGDGLAAGFDRLEEDYVWGLALVR